MQDCNGIAAPPVTMIIAGTSSVGCSYPTQPASSKCPEGKKLSNTALSKTASSRQLLSDTTFVTGTAKGSSTTKNTLAPTESTTKALPTISATIVTTETNGITIIPPLNTTGISTLISPSEPVFSTTSNLVPPKTSSTQKTTSLSSNSPVLSASSIYGSGKFSSTGSRAPSVSSASSSTKTPVSSSTNTAIPSSLTAPVSSSINTPISQTSSKNVDPGHSIISSPNPTVSEVGPIPTITLFDTAILTLTSIDSTISGDTAIYTSDGTHTAGLYPFIHGGHKCFFCPPHLDLGGIVLWGMGKPGVYPPPVPPPVLNVQWPTITIGPGNKPTPGPKPEEEEPDNSQSSQTSKSCTATTASSCAVSCTTPSGQSSISCTTKCETMSGCSVTNTASTTTKSGSCSPSNWASLPDQNVKSDGNDNGTKDPIPLILGQYQTG